MKTVLQAGNDVHLLRTRGAVLESAGFRVFSSLGIGEALDHIETGKFDVVILCHSLNGMERATVAAAVRRKNLSAPVLLVQGSGGQQYDRAPGIDAVLDSHPRNLLEALRSMLDLPGGEEMQVRRKSPVAEFRPPSRG